MPKPVLAGARRKRSTLEVAIRQSGPAAARAAAAKAAGVATKEGSSVGIIKVGA